MPIVLSDPTAPRRINFGDAVLHFRQPPGDVTRRLMRTVSARHGEDREAAVDAVVPEVAARYVTGWEGVLQPDGSPVEWPEAGRFGMGSEGPSEEAVARRAALVRALPWAVLARLDEALSTPTAEATASGKGSPSV